MKSSFVWLTALKLESCYDANFAVTGDTGGVLTTPPPPVPPADN